VECLLKASNRPQDASKPKRHLETRGGGQIKKGKRKNVAYLVVKLKSKKQNLNCTKQLSTEFSTHQSLSVFMSFPYKPSLSFVFKNASGARFRIAFFLSVALFLEGF
jgi:hypothetical protein